MPTLADLESKYFPVDPTVVPNSQNTEVIAHIDGKDYFLALSAAINATTGSGDVIYIVGWTFSEDIQLDSASTLTLKELLASKITLGVDVRIVIWTGRNQQPDNSVEFGDLGYWSGIVPGGNQYKSTVEANMVDAMTLRIHESPAGVKPFEYRVLMDWSGDTLGARHQKYVVVYNKSGQSLRAFVAGIDIEKQRQADSTHPDSAQSWHDAGVELIGEAARSVWADFKVRWEETLSLVAKNFILPSKGKRLFNPRAPTVAPGASRPPGNPGPLPLPGSAAITALPPTGKSVRIVRTYGELKDTWSSIPWTATPPAGGLRQVLSLYQKAINSAERYIYVEDQGLNNRESFTSHSMLYPLIGNAIRRGVKVVFVCGGDGADVTYSSDLYSSLSVPESSSNFVICRVKDVYVHSKIVLIDDEFAAIGSANFWDRSMDGTDTELTCALVETSNWVRDLRVKLMAEHFRVDVSDPVHKSVLEDVDQAFGVFGMGTYPIGFTRPNSRFYQLRDSLPSRRI